LVRCPSARPEVVILRTGPRQDYAFKRQFYEFCRNDDDDDETKQTLERRLQTNLFNEGLGETDDLVEAPPSQGVPGVSAAEVIAASNRRCVQLAGEEPDKPFKETAFAEDSKLQAICGIMLRDEVSDQFAANVGNDLPEPRLEIAAHRAGKISIAILHAGRRFAVFRRENGELAFGTWFGGLLKHAEAFIPYISTAGKMCERSDLH
jgi:hypothetical protein